VDDQSRLCYFRPRSPEPLFRFALIGLLVGLALYNGCTIALNFPIAMYRKLLGLPVDALEHIEDGWPALARGLAWLLEWDGDVENDFARSYTFEYDDMGAGVSVDMSEARARAANDTYHPSLADRFSRGTRARSRPDDPLGGEDRWPPPPVSGPMTGDAPMVTNENRNEFVKDYIFWLVGGSVAPQYEAFARGFFSVISKKSLELFDAEELRCLVEGTPRIDLDALQRTTKYENGYATDDPYILELWEVIRNFGDKELRQLLEFVTASDRVPAKGVTDMVFVIQQNGTGDEVRHVTPLLICVKKKGLG
jgi:hypothetical protein